MMDKKKMHVLLVGCGNIGGALLKLWSSLDIFAEVVVVQPSLASAEDFAQYDSIKFVDDVKNIPSDFVPDVVVLAIKPQMAEAVIPNLRPHIKLFAEPTIFEDFLGDTQRRTGAYFDVREDSSSGSTTKIPDRGRLCRNALVISALAGTSLDKLASLIAKNSIHNLTKNVDFCSTGSLRWLHHTRYSVSACGATTHSEARRAVGIQKKENQLLNCENHPIVRIMPTVAIKTSRSVNLAFANENVDATNIETVEKIIGLSGEITWVREENHLDILTPISGSGPAYFFLLAEILVEETVKLGIDEDTARHIIQGTLIGSASLVSDNVDFAALRESVTSKKGVTEAALGIMSSGMRNVMEESLKAAMQHLEELKK